MIKFNIILSFICRVLSILLLVVPTILAIPGFLFFLLTEELDMINERTIEDDMKDHYNRQ